MQGHKYSHICNLWGKFLPTGMICTTTDTISIPVGEMYLHAKMFCTLARTSFIPMVKLKVKSSIWPGASQWRIYYHRMWDQLSTTCSNLLK